MQGADSVQPGGRLGGNDQDLAGTPGFSVDPARLQSALLAEDFIELGIEATDVLRVATLPSVHRDPFDRWLQAQATEEGLTLLTADTTLKRYGRFVELV